MSDVGAPEAFDPWPRCDVHVEWGILGAELASARGDAIVVVDVMSFSTTLSIAIARDFTCLVYSGTEIAEMGGAEQAARRFGARPLSKRRRVEPGQVSLAPSSLLTAEPGQRVLFTSLNGAAVTAASATSPALVIAGLRNAGAAASLIAQMMDRPDVNRVTVIPCGEHWSSVEPGAEGMRPGVEDFLGAGLLCRRLRSQGLGLSAEAAVAAGAWTGPNALRSCISARELVAAGFGDDVDLALEVDADASVPVRDEAKSPYGRVFTGQRP